MRARGGTLYLTYDRAAAAAVSTAPPDDPVDTDGFDASGYLLVLDRRLPRPAEVRVELAGGERVVAFLA